MARVSGIESTPNPGCFLVKLSAPLSGLEGTLTGLKGQTFTPANAVFSASPELTTLLGLEGIDSVYAMELALTIHKKASAKWETVLPLVLQATCRTAEREDLEYQQFLQGLLSQASSNSDDTDTSSGQVRIRLQVSNNLPIQIEAIGFLGSTKRMKLSSPKFQVSMDELMNDKEANIDFFAGRTWLDRGMRYLVEDDDADADADAASSAQEEQEQVEIDEALRMEADEVTAAYSTQRLEAIVAERLGQKPKPTVSPNSDSLDGVINLETVDQYCDAAEHGDDNNEALIALANFVSSRRGSIPARRNALAFLGSAAGLEPLTVSTDTLDAVLEAIVSALVHEKSAAMRRTAGDALSDLGDARAVNAAIAALTNDRNKLVQWRAARVLGEMGDSMEVLGTLKAASFDKTYAFEVAFEIKDALRKVKARVVQLQNGGTGESLPNSGPIWKQIQEGSSS
eukprot:CAMPEP_0194406410 /NCGR_PEP_ID=MMETSP0176-20130528/4630_1 /TAXON_ID=216777 /ORGANISM="Proboscia alata, Strain PI-D3" /LENGTH=454 /DNA_ID=CAMNT_0039205619 /DNA_START=207 /DNA_END=1571 /DNA_ORIENTATION=+